MTAAYIRLLRKPRGYGNFNREEKIILFRRSALLPCESRTASDRVLRGAVSATGVFSDPGEIAVRRMLPNRAVKSPNNQSGFHKS